jgi:hypothetical protein
MSGQLTASVALRHQPSEAKASSTQMPIRKTITSAVG